MGRIHASNMICFLLHSYYGTVANYHVLVMDLLGPSIEDLFKYCSQRFTLKTVLMLADQVICCILSIQEAIFGLLVATARFQDVLGLKFFLA